MKNLLRTLLLALGTSAASFALAQPAPPYTVTVYGTVNGCTPTSSVNIVSVQGTLPAINIDVPVDPGSCTYYASLDMDSAVGWFMISTMCLGANQTQSASYVVNGLFPDSTLVYNEFFCNGGNSDCLGVPNGNAQPGTPCSLDGGITFGGIWSSSCQCVPDSTNCQACFTVQQANANPNGTGGTPWVITTDNCTTGNAPFTYQWWMPNGNSSSLAEPGYQFNAPGVYGICLTIADAGGCTSTMCDTIVVDQNGWISTGPVVWDCLQIANGPNMPGTACTTALGAAGTWSASCVCVANAPVDCEGVPGGSALPGTPCTVMTGGMVLTGTWTNNCMCDTSGTGTYDCLQILNGPNMPGTPCQNTPNGTFGTWSAECVCVPDTNTTGCQAGFWVFQAYEIDSLNPNGGATPIPYELWVWNLSTGVSPFQFLWSFGDGTSSTDPFPTHVYGNSGPYALCLTISDAAGCTSSYCDSVSIDDDGYYSGMAPEVGVVRSGFTIHVVNQIQLGVEEQQFADEHLWPNPVTDAMTLSFRSTMSGNVPLSIVDLHGRVMHQDNLAFARGANRIDLGTAQLASGMYMLRIGRDGQAMNIRFVKH